MSTLIAHKDTKRISLENLRKVDVPNREDLPPSLLAKGKGKHWSPLRHDFVVDSVIGMVNGVFIKGDFSISPNKSKLFGVMDFFLPERKGLSQGERFSIGMRHGNDMSLALKLSIGAKVVVCDNMMFTGEVVLNKRHTDKFDLRESLGEVREKVEELFTKTERNIEKMKGNWISFLQGREMIYDIFSQGIVPGKFFPQVSQGLVRHVKEKETLSQWDFLNLVNTPLSKLILRTKMEKTDLLRRYFEKVF